MAIGLLPEKVICDMQECISKLGEEFQDTRIPINDDNTNLHRFCSKLEFLLQNGLKDHGNLLRKRREYWDYFCHCLGSSRGNVHDGLKFVKSHPELKTSLARGRGFIRFCLMRQCLADTLQCCFVNEKITSAFYYERSILRQESQVSLLLSSLYELNDVQFDLSPRGYDLDVSWPTFARKMFDSSHLWQPPSRSMSISSLSSCVSQNDSIMAQSYSSNVPNIKEIDELRLEIERLENKMEELQQKLHRSEQQEEHSRLLVDEKEQQLLCLSKQLEAERTVHKTDINDMEENATKLQREWQEEKVELTDKLNTYLETSKEHTKRINRISSEYQSKDNDFEELQAKVIKLEEENGNILTHSLQLERDLKKNQEHLETQKAMSGKLDKTVSQLKIENETLKSQVKEELANTQIQSDEAMVQTCKELTEKLEASDASLLSITTEKERINRNLSKVEQINKLLEKIVGTLEKENNKLRQHLTIVEDNLNRTQAAFEKSQAANADLENEISEVRTELQNALDNSVKTVNELQMTKNFPMELVTAMENVMQPSNSDSLEVIERKRTEYIFRKERQNFNVQLEDFETERSNLHKNFEKLTLELKEATDKIGPLEKSLQVTMDELNKIKQIKDDEVSALQFQLSTESLKYERALKLDELQLSLSTRDEECTKLNEDLKKIVMELDQEKRVSDQLKAKVQETKEQNEKMILQHNSELLEMKSDNVDLKKNLIKLTREKDKLWKHSEKLSHHQKIQVTDRWMEDSETNSCLGCKSEFSFTIRKHHCRLCGRIFCNNCSNNWLLIAASKKQARVCKECFLQHIELQTEVTRTCSIANVAEDSEDDSEGGIPIASTSTSQLTLSPSSSAEPENQSPMTDNMSASSLPVSSPEISAVLESDSLPMYGSVPDLPSFCASRRSSHDYRLIQETKPSLNKQAAVSQATPFDEFDVISDEEIARSLSSYNPYIQTVNSGRKTDSRLHTTITRTAVDIASAGLTGVKGELWVNAGTQYGIPVVCDETSVLHWEFSTEPQRIAFSVAYKKSKTSTYDKFEMQPLLHTTHVSSSQHCVKGYVIMKNPGIYVLLFDNRFSRISAKKVKYLLLVNSIEECDAKTCKENVEH